MSLFNIEWAPLNVPLHRRLETLTAAIWIFWLLFGEFICVFIFCALVVSFRGKPFVFLKKYERTLVTFNFRQWKIQVGWVGYPQSQAFENIQNNKNCNRLSRKTLHNNDRLNRLNGNYISCKQYIYFIVFVSCFISRLFAVKFSINLMLLWNAVSPYERYVTKVITCMHSSATVTTAFIS